MDEIKLRLDVIAKLHAGVYSIPIQPAFELSYLQLRMICELIALACLAVHGESAGARTARLRSSAAADFILNALEQLNPQFYPEPGMSVTHPNGGDEFLLVEADYMTKPELLKLYWKCGDLLHRGNIETVGDEFPEPNFDEILTYVSKFANLLVFHRIAFLGSEDELWVTMRHPETGKVRATLKRPV